MTDFTGEYVLTYDDPRLKTDVAPVIADVLGYHVDFQMSRMAGLPFVALNHLQHVLTNDLIRLQPQMLTHLLIAGSIENKKLEMYQIEADNNSSRKITAIRLVPKV